LAVGSRMWIRVREGNLLSPERKSIIRKVQWADKREIVSSRINTTG
jgi:hypothetical protein